MLRQVAGRKQNSASGWRLEEFSYGFAQQRAQTSARSDREGDRECRRQRLNHASTYGGPRRSRRDDKRSRRKGKEGGRGAPSRECDFCEGWRTNRMVSRGRTRLAISSSRF